VRHGNGRSHLLSLIIFGFLDAM